MGELGEFQRYQCETSTEIDHETTSVAERSPGSQSAVSKGCHTRWPTITHTPSVQRDIARYASEITEMLDATC